MEQVSAKVSSDDASDPSWRLLIVVLQTPDQREERISSSQLRRLILLHRNSPKLYCTLVHKYTAHKAPSLVNLRHKPLKSRNLTIRSDIRKAASRLCRVRQIMKSITIRIRRSLHPDNFEVKFYLVYDFPNCIIQVNVTLCVVLYTHILFLQARISYCQELFMCRLILPELSSLFLSILENNCNFTKYQ